MSSPSKAPLSITRTHMDLSPNAVGHFVTDKQTGGYNVGFFQLPPFPASQYRRIPGAWRSEYCIAIDASTFNLEPFRIAIQSLKPSLPADVSCKEMVEELHQAAGYLEAHPSARQGFKSNFKHTVVPQGALEWTANSMIVTDYALELLDFNHKFTNIDALFDWAMESQPTDASPRPAAVLDLILTGALIHYGRCINVHEAIATAFARCAHRHPGKPFPACLVRIGAFVTALSWVRKAYRYKACDFVHASQTNADSDAQIEEFKNVMNMFNADYGLAVAPTWFCKANSVLAVNFYDDCLPVVGPVDDSDSSKPVL